MSESDEDTPTLSADTLAALQMFYSEQSLQHQKAQMAYELGNVTNINIQEDWQLSQFWYTENTATRLAQEALAVARPDGRSAVIESVSAVE